MASEIRELLKLLDQPDIISFAGGIPDPELFPREEISEAFAGILKEPASAKAALQYAISEGYPPLRRWIADYMGMLGTRCAPENILITNGSQQGLDFLGKLFIDQSDCVLVTRPTYLGAFQAFNCYQPNFDNFPRAGDPPPIGRPKLGYAMPDFQNPSGERLNLKARGDLLWSANEYDFMLIEDGAYEALRYEGEAITPLISLDSEFRGGIDNSRVVYCGTFSKTIALGLRVGWIAASAALIEKLILVKQAADLHINSLSQIVMHRIVTRYYFDRLPVIRAVYRARRDSMLAALAQRMPPGVAWTKPEGGMFVWLTLPPEVDGTALLQRAIDEEKIVFVPGRAFHFDGAGKNTLRLSFSQCDEAVIGEGIERLARLMASVLG